MQTNSELSIFHWSRKRVFDLQYGEQVPLMPAWYVLISRCCEWVLKHCSCWKGIAFKSKLPGSFMKSPNSSASSSSVVDSIVAVGPGLGVHYEIRSVVRCLLGQPPLIPPRTKNLVKGFSWGRSSAFMNISAWKSWNSAVTPRFSSYFNKNTLAGSALVMSVSA